MSKPLIQDGAEIREMNEAEFEQYEKDQAAYAKQAAADLAKAKQNATAKAAAEAKLAALGLTADDFKALGL